MNYKWRHCVVRNFVIILISLISFACHKKPSTIEVNSTITFTKQVDSLPCLVNIEYTDVTNGINNQQVSKNLTITHNLHFDETVTLSAKAIKNISQLKVEITANGETNSNSCNENNCTAYLKKNLYD